MGPRAFYHARRLPRTVGTVAGPSAADRWYAANVKLRTALLLVFGGGALLAPSSASAGGRYCERVDALCWRCADIAFPAAIPCTNPSACDPDDTLCVDQSGVTTCFTPTPYCCASAPCETAPGCLGAGSSCGDVEGDGRFDHCTFLSDCGDGGTASDAGPADAGAGDAGGSDAGPMDAGAGDAGPSDAGPADAGASDSDGGSAMDAAGPVDGGAPAPDGGRAIDGGVSRADGGGSPRKDDGGCGCAVPGRSPPPPLLVAMLVAMLVAVLVAGRRRRA